MNVDRELVLGLWTHLEDRYGTRTVPKDSSPMMSVVSRALHLARILDRDAFMNRFTTVIGRRIYAPFTPGEGSLVDQLDTCIHEHQHVVQLNRDGLPIFWSTYLVSSRSRALYEAEAYTCGIELRWWLEGKHPDPRRVASVLGNYGCSLDDVAAAADVLERNAARVRAG